MSVVLLVSQRTVAVLVLGIVLFLVIWTPAPKLPPGCALSAFWLPPHT
jgi:hypothetical protein